MYTLTQEQIKSIETQWLGRGHEITIRGWDLSPPIEHNKKLSIYEITNTFCRSKRDLFLRHVSNIEPIPSKAIVIGGMCHAIVAHIFKKIKEYQESKLDSDKLISYLTDLHDDREYIEEIIWEGNQLQNLKQYCDYHDKAYEDELDDIITWIQSIIQYEIKRVKDYWIGSHGSGMVIHSVEAWADATGLGTSWGRIDFIGSLNGERIIFDLKTGRSYKDNIGSRHQVTAYALALEKSLSTPINAGCLSFPLRKDKTLLDTPILDTFLINDDLRSGFLALIEDTYKVLEMDQPPAILNTFPCQWCGYSYICLG